MMCVCMRLVVCLVGFAATASGDVSPDNPPVDTCLCVYRTTSTLNFRDAACGSVIGSASDGECFRYRGGKVGCTMGNTMFQFFNMNYKGLSGWAAGNYLRYGGSDDCTTAVIPSEEFRSMFMATAWNIDWPRSSSDSSAYKMEQLGDYTDMMDKTNMNAIVFQARPAGDAFYQSQLEPWSRFLTGTQGVAPSPFFDPLSFLVTEAHRRNIEVHAWLNPYRANLSPTSSGLAPNHMAKRWPQYAYPYGNNLWMDPGASVIVDHLISVIEDIVTRYDVDGIHFDDYFYPYPITGVDFPDTATYNAYLAEGGLLSRPDWRRQNVNQMVERVYNRIKATKPAVKFSISPFGLYRPGQSGGMPSPIVGLDPYTAMYADSLRWLENGWLDFLAPQLYWAEDPPGQRYSTLLDWWLDHNPLRRHIYAANGVYRLADSNNWPVSEITRQVTISRDGGRRVKKSLGNVLFSAKYFRDNTKNIRTIFANSVYPNKATIPAMAWLGVEPPGRPVVTVTTRGVILESNDVGAIYRWVVNRLEGSTWVVYLIVNPDEVSTLHLPPGEYSVNSANRAWVKSLPLEFNIL